MNALTDDELALLEDACRLSGFHHMKALETDPRAAATCEKMRGALDRVSVIGNPDLAHRLFQFICHNELTRRSSPTTMTTRNGSGKWIHITAVSLSYCA